jgi:hypothetical protein
MGLLKSLKKQEVCVMNMQRDIYVACSIRMEEVVSAAQESKKKCVTFHTTDWSLNQHCMENLS